MHIIAFSFYREIDRRKIWLKLCHQIFQQAGIAKWKQCFIGPHVGAVATTENDKCVFHKISVLAHFWGISIIVPCKHAFDYSISHAKFQCKLFVVIAKNGLKC